MCAQQHDLVRSRAAQESKQTKASVTEHQRRESAVCLTLLEYPRCKLLSSINLMCYVQSAGSAYKAALWYGIKPCSGADGHCHESSLLTFGGETVTLPQSGEDNTYSRLSRVTMCKCRSLAVGSSDRKTHSRSAVSSTIPSLLLKNFSVACGYFMYLETGRSGRSAIVLS